MGMWMFVGHKESSGWLLRTVFMLMGTQNPKYY
jgi:hypothetical protein